MPRIILTLLLLNLLACSVDTSKIVAGNHKINSCANIYVADRRPYILSGEKNANFVGIVRGGYGNPYNFSTSSGNPLASDLGQALQRSLTSSNNKVQFYPNELQLKNSAGCKTIALTVREWKIDAMINAWFKATADLSVYSADGKLLAKKEVTENYPVSGSFWNPVGAAGKNFLAESSKTLTNMLSDEMVVKALR